MRKKSTKKTTRTSSVPSSRKTAMARRPAAKLSSAALKSAKRSGKQVMSRLSASLSKPRRNLKKAVHDGNALMASQYNQASKKARKVREGIVRAKDSIQASIEQHPVAAVATAAAAAAIGAGLIASKAVGGGHSKSGTQAKSK